MTQHYRLGPATAVLETAYAPARDWADEFLHPLRAPDPAPDTALDHVVAVYGDDAPPASTGPTTPQPLFLGRLGERWQHDDVDIVRATDRSDWYEVRPGWVVAHYIGADIGADPMQVREPARLVRECLVDQVCAAGAVRLHAAAAIVDGVGLLLVGPAGAGKSSTVAQLLAAGADFIANDRVLVLPGEAGPVLYGVPLAVRWSRAQLDPFPGGARFLAEYFERSRLRRSDDRAGFVKYELTPAEIGEVVGRPVVTSAPLGAVVVVDRRVNTEGRAGCEELDPAAGRAALAACVLANDPSFPRFFRPHRASLTETTGSRPSVPDWLDTPHWLRVQGRYDDPAAVRSLLTTGGFACTSPSSPHLT